MDGFIIHISLFDLLLRSYVMKNSVGSKISVSIPVICKFEDIIFKNMCCCLKHHDIQPSFQVFFPFLNKVVSLS